MDDDEDEEDDNDDDRDNETNDNNDDDDDDNDDDYEDEEKNEYEKKYKGEDRNIAKDIYKYYCNGKSSKSVADELLELLFGLSIALYTQPLIDGQPSSTILVYFSGILGYSSSSKSFRPARCYTLYLSGLLYI